MIAIQHASHRAGEFRQRLTTRIQISLEENQVDAIPLAFVTATLWLAVVVEMVVAALVPK